ncbi:MAG TPA: hypothetical protein VMF56_04705 [Acidobacteriaceae bacterium]|nr:hypothetical protein [Acidobacteriaceae bacterium]
MWTAARAWANGTWKQCATGRCETPIAGAWHSVASCTRSIFHDVFGAEKTGVRQVIGMTSLPLGMPIELEVIFEVAE